MLCVQCVHGDVAARNALVVDRHSLKLTICGLTTTSLNDDVDHQRCNTTDVSDHRITPKPSTHARTHAHTHTHTHTHTRLTAFCP